MKDLKKVGEEIFKGFIVSFDEERKNVPTGSETGVAVEDQLWALPAENRTYYLVRFGKKPYMLVGMSHHDTISSIAKITSSMSGKGAECLRVLIERELVHKCYAGVVQIQLGRECDPRIYSLLLDLKNDLPDGVEKIYVFNDAASIICEKKSQLLENKKTA